jgi:hypothetical protein
MEAKKKEYYINGFKPRNTFSMEILKNAVGNKDISKLKRSITSGKIGRVTSGTQSRITKIRKTRTEENIAKITSFNMLNNLSSSKIEECKEEDEEDIPIDHYLVGSDASDTESEEEDNGENTNMTLGAANAEFVQKDPQALVDQELTTLLAT